MNETAYFPTIDRNPNFISRPPDPGFFRTMAAVGRDALYHSPFSGTYRASEMFLESSEFFNVDGNLLSPEDANRRFGLGGQLTFDEPIKESAADLMMRRKIAENDREYETARGMTTGFRRIAGIGMGMAASLADPINVGSMFVPVVGEARFARMVQQFGGSLLKARLASGAIEGAVGAALVEPFVLLPAMQEQSNYGLADSAMNLGYGAVLGGFLHAGLGAVADRIKSMRPNEQDAIFEAAIGNILSDEPVRAPAMMEQFRELQPEVRVTRMEMGGKIAEQVDVIVPGQDRPIFSGTREQAEAAGYTIPEETIRAAAAPTPTLQEILDSGIDNIPRRDPRGRFLSNTQRLELLKQKLDSERTRMESQDKNISQEIKTDIPRINTDELRNTSESPEVMNQITKEADELQAELDRRVPVDDEERIQFEAEKQALNDMIRAEIGDPKKRETGVRAAVKCITDNLI